MGRHTTIKGWWKQRGKAANRGQWLCYQHAQGLRAGSRMQAEGKQPTCPADPPKGSSQATRAGHLGGGWRMNGASCEPRAAVCRAPAPGTQQQTDAGLQMGCSDTGCCIQPLPVANTMGKGSGDNWAKHLNSSRQRPWFCEELGQEETQLFTSGPAWTAPSHRRSG